MRGSVTKRGTSYSYTVDVGRDSITNKRIRKSKSGFKTKKEAEESLIQLLASFNNNESVKVTEKLQTHSDYPITYNNTLTDNISLNALLDFWINSKHNISETTRENYISVINRYLRPYFKDTLVKDIKAFMVDQYFNEMVDKFGLSSTTCVYHNRIIKQVFKYAYRNELINKNIMELIEPPRKSTPEVVVLPKDELLRLLRLIKGHPLEATVFLGITTGMRRGELLSLKFQNVNFNKKTIYVADSLKRTKSNKTKFAIGSTKTRGSVRTISVSESVIEYILGLKQRYEKNKILYNKDFHDNQFILCHPDGKFLRPDYVTKSFKRFVRDNNFPEELCFKTLRHQHATLLLAMGIQPKIVQERLGHSSIKLSMDTYSHFIDNIQQEASDKLETQFLNNLNFLD